MRVALVAALAVGSSCSAGRREVPSSSFSSSSSRPHGGLGHEEPEPEEVETTPLLTSRSGDPVILVTIDGVRWQDIFEGSDQELSPGPRRLPRDLVPNLDRLARKNGAALGAPGHSVISATGPNFVSLPGYTEIFTGRAPIGCQDNTCEAIHIPTLLDDAHDAGASVAAFGSWEILDRAVSARPGSFLVSCGRDADENVDPWPGVGNFRPDRLTAQRALHHLASERPDVLYIGLGEPDEYGHHNDYAGYLRALTFADGVIGRIMSTLEHMGPRGARTHVFVTADHGRAHDFKGHGGGAPESARVWLIAGGPAVVARGLVDSSHQRHLSDIAPTLRTVIGLPPNHKNHHDRDRGWRGQVLGELFALD
jgi:hypothetical protein